MGFNLYFDVAALIILLFLMLSVILKRQNFGTGNKLYIVIIICAIAAGILDIAASLEQIPIPVLFWLNTFYMLSRAAVALSIFLYACNLGKILFRMIRKVWPLLLISIPYLLLIIGLIVNFFNKAIFDYLPGPAYHRGDYVWLVYFVNYTYLAMAICIAIYGRKYHTKRQGIAVISALIIQISASIFQYFVKEILVEMFITSLTLLTLSLFVESPENFIDFKTDNLNFRSFTYELKYKFQWKTNFNIIFIKVTNSSSIYNLFPHEQVIAFNRACSAHVHERAKKIDPTAMVYYLGNETFAYLFDNREKDEEVFQEIRGLFAKPMTHKGISFLFNAKMCLVHCPEDTKDVASIIGFSTVFFELMRPESHHLNLSKYRTDKGNILFHLDHILEKAIKDQSFSVYYQGIYSLKEKKFVAAEGLVRLNDPDFGLIMPALMIPYSESCGKMIRIGQIIIEKTFEFFAFNLRGVLDYVEVNLSPNQLLDPNLIQNIDVLAKKYGIESHEIIFEITETTAIDDDPSIGRQIKQLQERGYRIAIDDFGTGYSNISRLMELDIAVLKFDKSMTELLDRGDSNDFFEGLLPIFKNRNVTILFEGVEKKETVEKLIALGVDHIQGYYYSKPFEENVFLNHIHVINKK